MKRLKNKLRVAKKLAKKRSFITRLQNFLAGRKKPKLDQRLSPGVSSNLHRMSNWQNSQWLRSGANPKDTEKFVNLERRP